MLDPDRPVPAKRERMARVLVDDDTWHEFRDIAGYRPISEVMGELVEREVGRAKAARLRAGHFDDRQVVEALERAREQQAVLASIVARLERLPHS